MISLCTVITKSMQEEYLNVLIHSVLTNCNYVKEIIAIRIDGKKNSLHKRKHIKGKDIQVHKRVLFNEHVPFNNDFAQMICGHALGLHYAIELATQEYIWICDPDVFFLANVDEVFVNLINQHKLNIVGVSHFNHVDQSYSYFPCAINCMVKRKDLPDKKWLENKLYVQTGMRIIDVCRHIHPVNGKYLIPGPLFESSFPNPNGIFDIGCNLWLWNEQKNGKWMSFFLDYHQPSFNDNHGFDFIVYPMNYSTKNIKSNFDFNQELPEQDLLYHRTRASKVNDGSYRELYSHLFPSYKEWESKWKF